MYLENWVYIVDVLVMFVICIDLYRKIYIGRKK